MNGMQKFATATTRMMIYHPFYSTMMLSVPYEITTKVKTAATSGRKHFYNPDLLDRLSVEGIMWVRAHETLHDMLKHMMRMGTRIHPIWNEVTDYVINYILKKSGFKQPEGFLWNEELGQLSAEEAYARRVKENEEEKKNGGEGAQPKDTDDLLDPGLTDDEDAAELDRELTQRVAKAASLAQMQGRLPAELEMLIDKLLHPQVPWEYLLREYMTRLVRSNETWNRRNRRFTHVFLPGRESHGMGEVCVIPDTSGSMTHVLPKVVTEINAIAEEVRPERVRVMWADTQVNEQVFEEGEPMDFKAVGGGGTDMRVPLAYAEQYDPQVVILLTDGDTPWPAVAPPYPLIVICTTNREIPFGDVIRIS